MNADDTDPTAEDPFDDGQHLDPDLFDAEDLTDPDDPSDECGPYTDEPSASYPAADEEAIVLLCVAGGPLELTADPAADAELRQWLDDPPPEVATAEELATLDRLLRAGLAQE